MTPADLTAISERLRDATPGPWTRTKTPGREKSLNFLLSQFEASDGDDLHGAGVGAPGKTVEEECLSTAITGNGPTSEANAEFIAHAPADIAALLAEVERLRQSLAVAQQATTCAGCGVYKHTPNRMDGEFGGYVCGGCMEARIHALRETEDSLLSQRDDALATVKAQAEEIARLRVALKQACTCATCNGNDPIEVYELDECPECAGQKIGMHVEEGTARVLEEVCK